MDCSFRFRFTHKIFYHLWDRWFLSIIDGQLDLSNDTVGTGSPSHWLATMSINHQPLIIMITEKIHLGKTALSVNSNSFLRNLTDKLARLRHGNKDTVGTGSLYHDVNQHLIRYIKLNSTLPLRIKYWFQYFEKLISILSKMNLFLKLWFWTLTINN